MIMQLYPAPECEVTLKGLYLQPHLLSPISDEDRFQSAHVYTNYIASLDRRIAITQPVTGKSQVPDSIINPRDWRLYQELAARADALLISARLLWDFVEGQSKDGLPVSCDPVFADLLQWRQQQGLSPQPAVVIVSRSLDLPITGLQAMSARSVYVATGEQQTNVERIGKIEETGATLLFAGAGPGVDGKRLIEQLVVKGLHNIYSIAGPGILATLVRAKVLSQIYLTQVHRLIGGTAYDTLFEGALLQPPTSFKLKALYYDNQHGESCSQFFSIYEVDRQNASA